MRKIIHGSAILPPNRKVIDEVNESSRVREMQMMICKARLVVKRCSQKEVDI